jgi:hypothetical protein
MPLNQRYVVLILLTPILILATACDHNTPSKRAEAYRTPNLDIVETARADQQLPFDRYRLSDTDRLRMDDGYATLLQSCVQQRWPAAPQKIPWASDYIRPADHTPVLWGGPLGTMTLEHAQRFGYLAGPTDPYTLGPGFYIKTLGNMDFEHNVPAATDRRLQRIVNGVGEGDEKGQVDRPGDSCRTAIYNDLNAPTVDITNVQSDVMNLAFNHRQVQERMKQWAACMRGAGEAEYKEVDDPDKAFWVMPLSKAQIKVAVKDVKCTQQSRWADYYYAALADYEEQAIKANPQLFESALRSEQDRLAAIERQGITTPTTPAAWPPRRAAGGPARKGGTPAT